MGRFCGVSDREGFGGGQLCRWRRKQLRWVPPDSSVPGIDYQTLLETISEAFADWADLCGLAFVRVEARPDIIFRVVQLDGPGQTLADAQLPCAGDDRPLTIRLDRSESFVLSQNPPAGKVDLLSVVSHEIGHALGLPHERTGSGALMEPTIQPGVRRPGAIEQGHVVTRYGQGTNEEPRGELLGDLLGDLLASLAGRLLDELISDRCISRIAGRVRRRLENEVVSNGSGVSGGEPDSEPVRS